MKNRTIKLGSIALSLALLLSAAPATVSFAASAPDELAVYMTSKDYGYTSISINDLGNKTITGAASDNAGVISVTSYTNETTKITGISTDKINTYISGYVSLSISKAGKANITTQVGSQTLKTKVTAYAYENPAKNLTITGVNGGKDISGKFASGSYSTLKIAKAAKSGKLTITPKANWAVQDIYFSNSSPSDSNYNYYYHSYSVKTPKAGKKVTTDLGGLSKNGSGIAGISFVNTKTGGTLHLTVNLSNNSN